MPPLLEYVESLLTGTGHDLDLQTFKLVDQLSGPHAGRARRHHAAGRAHRRASAEPQRASRGCATRAACCTRCRTGMNRTREPLQIGAEIYGHAGIESDVEIQRLMMRALRVGGRRRRLSRHRPRRRFSARWCSAARIERELEAELFRAMQAKDVPALRELTRKLDRATARGARWRCPSSTAVRKCSQRGAAAAAGARRRSQRALARPQGAVARALATSRASAASISRSCAATTTTAAWCSRRTRRASRMRSRCGGRYDEVGKAFGRARPATGFSMDLRELAAARAGAGARGLRARAVCAADDAALQRRDRALRARGDVVIVELPGHARRRAASCGCDRAAGAAGAGKWT